MFKSKGTGLSFYHPLGIDSRFPKHGLEPEQLSTLTKKLRDGSETPEERKMLAESFIHLALAIGGRYAAPSGRKLDDFVSCALFGIVHALNKAKEKMHDDDLNAWVAGCMHGFCRRFRTVDHVTRVPQTTNASRKSKGQELIEIKPTILATDLEQTRGWRPQNPWDKRWTLDKCDSHDDLALAELKEVLYEAAKDDIDRQIIDLRLLGHKDNEIAAILECSNAHVHKRRTDIKHRYERSTQ